MAISNGFWPLDLSVESLVLREILPTISQGGDAREVTDRVDIFATNFAHLAEKARRYPNEFALRYLEQRDYHRT